jgi:chromosome segregation ATPase
VWFELHVADEFRQLKLTLPQLQLQITSLEQRAAERDAQLATYHDVVALDESALNAAKSGMETFARTAREASEEAQAARAELNKWYRSPWLWMLAGAVGTAAVVITVKVAGP